MNRSGIVCALALLTLGSSPARAQNWSLGANVGLSVLSPKGGGDALTNFSWPGGGNEIFGEFLPGLRVGLVGAGERHEFYVDTGVNATSFSGESIHNILLTLNYQYNASTDRSAPFVTVGAGVTSFDGGGDSFTNGILGGGAGILHRLGNGHGAVRGEVHVDYITEDKNGLEGGTLVGLKLGFDLWMK